MHWNHHYMPHWKPAITDKYPRGRHVPPDDIGASFYPELGCYSSKDPAVIDKHLLQLRSAGAGVIAVSWYPAGLSDDEGPPPDPVIPVLLDAALTHGVKIMLHIEPYKGRTPQSVRNDLQYIHTTPNTRPSTNWNVSVPRMAKSVPSLSSISTTHTSVRPGSGRPYLKRTVHSLFEGKSVTVCL